MSKRGTELSQVYMRPDIARVWPEHGLLETAFALRGEIFREVPGRRTMRVQIAGANYFVKLHYGVGWAEIVKNWMQFKWPVVGAANEYLACSRLQAAGIAAPKPAAYAESKGSIAKRRSFVLTDELAGYTSLEDVTDNWPQQPPTLVQRRAMLKAVAAFAKTFHDCGFIHRDFYICHLLADDEALALGQVKLAVLDLHRARQFENIPKRWLKRDLAALVFSSMDLGFSRRDWLRFLRYYTGQPLTHVLNEQGAFWQSVLDRAEKLYDEGLRKGTVKGVYRS
jgi:lipopolysaccharide core heptose(I) kinase